MGTNYYIRLTHFNGAYKYAKDVFNDLIVNYTIEEARISKEECQRKYKNWKIEIIKETWEIVE